MPHIGFTPAQEEKLQENRRIGSLMLTLGWILLAMNGLAAMFVFQDIREGTHLWLIMGTVVGVIGLTLIAVGTIKRRQIPT
jgi:hypothetical protein